MLKILYNTLFLKVLRLFVKIVQQKEGTRERRGKTTFFNKTKQNKKNNKKKKQKKGANVK